MKNDTSKTNYLAAAKTSKYDALQRQVSSLIQHWMDHTSNLKESKLIPLLCDYIENTQLPHFQVNQAEIFSTKSDFFLGRIIQFFIEIQDGDLNKEELTEKRVELEKILNKFSILNHKKGIASDINLQSINEEKESEEQQVHASESDQPTKRKWWFKILNFVSKQR